MIIQKIEIENFRSYYNSTVFELTTGLNLIIGSNGEGKTTFFEALEWLFRTDGTGKTDIGYISKKRISELFPDDSDNVRVAMTYEHKGSIKTLEKTFRFTKSFDGEISISNYSFNLIEQSGVERIVKDGTLFDQDIPSEVRRYIMFKGETDLNVFQRSNALKLLVETFSDVKEFEAYFSFMEYAKEKSQQARDNAQKVDTKNSKRIKELNYNIDKEKGLIGDAEREIRVKASDADGFEVLLNNIEKSKDASELLKAVNNRIEGLTSKANEIKARIKENYTIDLLDSKWILMGFQDIAEEYSKKIGEFDKKRRKLEKEYIASASAEKVIKKMQTDFTPLPVHIPGQQIMQEMLDDEVCKICGRPAKKHSEAWEFMLHRLEEFKESIKDKVDDEIEPYYKNEYIVELQKRDTTLNDHLIDISRLRHTINDVISFNNRLHSELKKIESNLEQELDQKKRILAQTDGLTEEQLLANYENISNWMTKKNDAENRVRYLQSYVKDHTEILESYQAELDKIAEGTSAAIYSKTAQIIKHISNAFSNAKDTNKKRLLHSIEDEANIFMEKLNINDFKGSIRIIEKADGQGEAVLMDSDNTRIFNPNTALRTTYLMSVLFAIGKLSSEKDKSATPLIFDAPTSSFVGSKENDFFNVMSKLDKQVIVATKCFLKESPNGEISLDSERVNQISGNVYLIERQKPFDDRNLATIQTVTTKIK